MKKFDAEWSLDALLRNYHPHAGWRAWFADAYAQAMESGRSEEQLRGWKQAATIFGDMHRPLFCLFVCRHGQSLASGESEVLLGHINLCLWEMGLAEPVHPDATGAVRSVDFGKPETFHRDLETEHVWFTEQLQPFGGDVGRAAKFAMRLTAARFGLLRGPADPTIDQILDESLWEYVGPEMQPPQRTGEE